MASTTLGSRSGAIPINNKNDANSLASINSRAVESAVDAFASRILQTRSPPEACVDGSLGPYVASILRCSFSESSNASNIGIGNHDFDLESEIPEFESLMELLEEHCCMDPGTAMNALRSIAISVRTGIVDWQDDPGTALAGSFNVACSFNSSISIGSGNVVGRLGRPFRSISLGNEGDYSDDMINSMLGQMLQDSANSAPSNSVESGGYFERNGFNHDSPLSNCSPEPDVSFVLEEDVIPASTSDQPITYGSASISTFVSHDTEALQYGSAQIFPSPAKAGETGRNDTGIFTPVKLDSLIPGDLLGVLDDPSTPAPPKDEDEIKRDDIEKDTNALPQAVNDGATSKKLQGGKGKKKSKEAAQDLAAALFHTSRPRSNSSISETKSPKLKAMSGPPPGMVTSMPSSPGTMSFPSPNLFEQQLNSATQILLSMNSELGDEAATEAALVSNADVNVAQYVIDGAMAAPPVCRHMLNNACYRSDCQFSHDVEGHTCLFWLRGRCGKGEACRFLHGFSEKLLDGMKSDFLPEHHRAEEKEAAPFMIPPAASQPPTIQTTNLVQHNMRLSHSSPQKSPGLFPALSGVHDPKSPHHSMLEVSTNGKMEGNKKKPVGSFASIASKGYSKNGSYPMGAQGSGISNPVAAPAGRTASNHSSRNEGRAKFARIPQELWNPCYNRDAGVFQIPDPIERYKEVSMSQPRKDVIDLHFQSTKTFPVVLSKVLPEKLRIHKEVWVVTGSGHHVNKNSHQKTGGILENAVLSWLDAKKYPYFRGRDKNGHGGAVLVKPR